MNSIEMEEKDLQKAAALNKKPRVSIVVPAFNEASLILSSLAAIHDYMQTIDKEYSWELIVVNDGSRDETGELAESFARSNENIVVLHHLVNFNVGQALKYAFSNCTGDYVVVLDMDLSYSPEHIGLLLDTIRKTRAKIVIASPYMKAGKISGVPWLRRTLSVCANKFLSYTSKGGFSTLTGMVRAYDRRFLQSLSLKSMDMSICAEIIYKAQVLRARIVEIPAHLDWSLQNKANRKSSIKIQRSMIAYLLSGFMFRPFLFFIFPGIFLFFLACYSFGWSLLHAVDQYIQLAPDFGPVSVKLSASVASAFEKAPHTFVIGGTALMISIQLVSLGIISLQSKRYFEEIFFLGSGIYQRTMQNEITIASGENNFFKKN